MRFQLAVLVLALLFVPTPAHAEDPVVMVETLGGELVRVVGHVDPAVVGTVLAVCNEEGMEPGETLTGYVKSDCFEAVGVDEGVGIECDLVRVTIIPHIPAAGVSPNSECAIATTFGVLALGVEVARAVLEYAPLPDE